MSVPILVFMTFRVETVYGFENWSERVKILKFKIWVVQTLSNKKLTITPNVDLDEFDILCIYDFFILIYL